MTTNSLPIRYIPIVNLLYRLRLPSSSPPDAIASPGLPMPPPVALSRTVTLHNLFPATLHDLLLATLVLLSRFTDSVLGFYLCTAV
jgi:hypothetical protein